MELSRKDIVVKVSEQTHVVPALTDGRVACNDRTFLSVIEHKRAKAYDKIRLTRWTKDRREETARGRERRAQRKEKASE